MDRGWPREELKEKAKDQILGEHERARVEKWEDTREKYNALKNTIERLQKGFNLCMQNFDLPGRKTIYIIHGCPSKAEESMRPETRTCDKHWMLWIKGKLENIP